MRNAVRKDKVRQLQSEKAINEQNNKKKIIDLQSKERKDNKSLLPREKIDLQS
jgi:hypothetical protein